MGHWKGSRGVDNFVNRTVVTERGSRGGIVITLLAKDVHDLVKARGLEGLKEIAEKVAQDAKANAPVDNTPQGAQRRKRQRRAHLRTRIRARQTRRSTYVLARFPAFFVERGHDVYAGGMSHKGGRVVGRAEPAPFLEPAFEKAPQYVRSAIAGKV